MEGNIFIGPLYEQKATGITLVNNNKIVSQDNFNLGIRRVISKLRRAAPSAAKNNIQCSQMRYNLNTCKFRSSKDVKFQAIVSSIY